MYFSVIQVQVFVTVKFHERATEHILLAFLLHSIHFVCEVDLNIWNIKKMSLQTVKTFLIYEVSQSLIVYVVLMVFKKGRVMHYMQKSNSRNNNFHLLWRHHHEVFMYIWCIIFFVIRDFVSFHLIKFRCCSAWLTFFKSNLFTLDVFFLAPFILEFVTWFLICEQHSL